MLFRSTRFRNPNQLPVETFLFRDPYNWIDASKGSLRALREARGGEIVKDVKEGLPAGAARGFQKEKAVPLIIVGALCIGLLYLFQYFAPLEIASVTVYAGIVVALGGVLCLIKPIWRLGIRSRKLAALVILLGAALAVVGLYWPAGVTRISARQSRLDDFMPDYHFSEYHEIRVHATPDKVSAALQGVTFDELRVYHALMRIRGFAFGRNIKTAALGQRRVLDSVSKAASGFVKLDEDSQEIVFAMAGRPWATRGITRCEDRAAFEAFNDPGAVKIASNLRVKDEGGGWSRVTTETRIRATDETARRTMGVYWRLIYPGSGMIRRTWLNAIRARAERPNQ